LWFEASLGKKVCKIPISTEEAANDGLHYHPSYEGSLNRRITVQVKPGIKM
jgi:hypothetical protein